MIVIKDKEFGGERPLYKLHDARLERVTIHFGESSIKESGNIEAYDCTFEGKYVLYAFVLIVSFVGAMIYDYVNGGYEAFHLVYKMHNFSLMSL